MSRISARIRTKLADPHYFDDIAPDAGQEFVSRDGNVTLGHIGPQVVGIELKDDYFRRAPVMAATDTIQRAFEEFYDTDPSDGPTTDHDPELTADRAQLRRILEELETL